MSSVEPQSWLRQVLLELLRTSTEVPVGHTQILPGDPRIMRAVDEAVTPIIEALGPDDVLRHESGDVAARFGPERDESLAPMGARLFFICRVPLTYFTSFRNVS